MDWLYVWSPRYRFFHEFLFSQIKDLSGFHITPVFAPQKFFTPIQSEGHFLTGIPIKIHVIMNYIQKNMGKTFFFTDVDLIVLPEFKYQELEQYTKNDITCMYEESSSIHYNIGCLLIQCNEKTLEFFKNILGRIQREKLLDQDAFAKELSTFPGTFGFFNKEEYLQSNMLTEDTDSYKIIQCLSSEIDKTRFYVEKILTISSAYDISLLLDFLPEDVREVLQTEFGMGQS